MLVTYQREDEPFNLLCRIPTRPKNEYGGGRVCISTANNSFKPKPLRGSA
ncbi:hypothetical protein J2X06_002463 [Lysobacter niastensis]|uniref:Uncharacterized protein n=1 Tax=Lysobacter niastensis TaxID=380629 RepID=A0ABU1WC94_9GAMM|nr:hypothetical protein [Lysobacter niastensis]